MCSCGSPPTPAKRSVEGLKLPTAVQLAEVDKMFNVLKEPLGEKLLNELPGIGEILSNELRIKGYSKVWQLCELLLKNQLRYEDFRSELSIATTASTDQIVSCYVCLVKHVENFGPPVQIAKTAEEEKRLANMIQDYRTFKEQGKITWSSDVQQCFDCLRTAGWDAIPTKYKPLCREIFRYDGIMPKTEESTQVQQNYKVCDILGKGGFGIVFKMREKTSKTERAVKVMSIKITSQDIEEQKRIFLREVGALARLDHERIVRYHNSWTELLPHNWMDLLLKQEKLFTPETKKEGCLCLFMAMELCSHGTVKDFLDKNSNIGMKTLKIIFLQIVEAVVYIHEQRLMHRDLKPSNIFLTKERNVKVGDFGLAKSLKDNIHPTRTAGLMQPSTSAQKAKHTIGVGTKLYMSPEVIRGESDYTNKVDIFSLGVIFYEMVFLNDRSCLISELKSVRECQFPPLFKAKYPSEHGLIMKMLARNHGDRPTAEEILNHACFKSKPVA